MKEAAVLVGIHILVFCVQYMVSVVPSLCLCRAFHMPLRRYAGGGRGTMACEAVARISLCLASKCGFRIDTQNGPGFANTVTLVSPFTQKWLLQRDPGSLSQYRGALRSRFVSCDSLSLTPCSGPWYSSVRRFSRPQI